MGQNHVPFPIGGDGEITSDKVGLALSGYKVGSDRSCAFAFLVVLSLLVLPGLFVGISSSFDMEIDPEDLKYILLLIIGGMVSRFAYKKKREVSNTQPLEVRIPWDKVKWVKIADDGCIQILVVKHSPKGLVYFYPEENAEKVASELRSFISAAA